MAKLGRAINMTRQLLLNFEKLLRTRLIDKAGKKNLMPIPIILSQKGFADLHKSKDYLGLDTQYILACKNQLRQFII